MGETHQTNWLNVIPGLATKINPLLGMAVSKVMDSLGEKYAGEDDSKLGTGLLGKIRRALRDRYVKNQANKAGQTPNHLGGSGSGAGGLGSPLGSGSFMGGSYGFTGGGSVTIGGTGQGEISDGTSGAGPLDQISPDTK
jgi:hypothetical protein